MTKKDIRLQYSGFVIFAAKMVSVVTGLIFQFIVARALNKEQYDLWFNINDLVAYFVLLAGVLPFWAMRFATRDKEGAIKTGIVANMGISAVATVIYILVVPFILSALNISTTFLPIYLIVAVQIVETYSIAVLESSLQARVPRTIGYGLLVQQVAKVATGYILIVQLQQLLLGAVVAAIIGFALQTMYYLRVLADELKQRMKREYIKEWLKGSVISIYNVIGNQTAAYIFIMLFAYGGEGARGKLGAAAIIVNVITYSSFLAYALYPKLLAEKKCEDITTCLKMVLMFAIPLTAGGIALSDSYVTILKPEHADAGPVLTVLALDAFVLVVSGVFNYVLYGYETVDEEAKFSLPQLVRSRLFIAFSLPYLQSVISLPTAFYVLTNFAANQPFQAAVYVAIINTSARFAMFLIQYGIVRKMVKITIPWKNIGKYLLAALAMGTVLYVIPHPTRISTTLVETAAGGAIYIALLMLIDKEARKLPSELLKEIRQK